MPAENALALMKSRYAAYAKGNVDYVIKTTHRDTSRTKNTAKWKQELAQFASSTQFIGLKIIEFVDGDKFASVTFTAILIQDGRDVTFTEKSSFLKVDGQWLYRSGEIQKNMF